MLAADKIINLFKFIITVKTEYNICINDLAIDGTRCSYLNAMRYLKRVLNLYP